MKYYEALYILSQKSNAVRQLAIAAYMNSSKPSVNRAIGLLKNGGYIESDGEGLLHLTDAGTAVAEKTYERHSALHG